MTIPDVIDKIKNGEKIMVYGCDLALCNESSTGLKVVLSNGASYYASYTDVSRSEVV